MVSNPFKHKKKQSTEIERDLKIEAGFTKIEGTQTRKERSGYTAEEIDVFLKIYEDRIKVLQANKTRTSEEDKELDQLLVYAENWHMAKMVIQSATPWLRSGDNQDMSKRYADYCFFFGRNWKDPNKQAAIVTASLYLHGISHIEKDVEPAPTILVQTPIMPGFQRGIDPAQTTNETISRNRD